MPILATHQEFLSQYYSGVGKLLQICLVLEEINALQVVQDSPEEREDHLYLKLFFICLIEWCFSHFTWYILSNTSYIQCYKVLSPIANK